jgi:hypothetical protein
MLSPVPLLGAIALASSLATASSFYDNPEQDPIRESGTPLDELEQKWSTDVSRLCQTVALRVLLTRESGGSVASQRLPILSMSGA